MAQILTRPLDHAHVQLLKARILKVGADFAAEQGLDPASVDHELGFIWAHLAAGAGVLDKPYQAWLDAHKPGTRDDAGGHMGAPDHVQLPPTPVGAGGFDPRDDDGG